jgi:hypothetical protein
MRPDNPAEAVSRPLTRGRDGMYSRNPLPAQRRGGGAEPETHESSSVHWKAVTLVNNDRQLAGVDRGRIR